MPTHIHFNYHITSQQLFCYNKHAHLQDKVIIVEQSINEKN